jgi:hypothetical protein
MNISNIPDHFYLPARIIVSEGGLNYSTLKGASNAGGILKRWRSPKTRRVFYKSKIYSMRLG